MAINGYRDRSGQLRFAKLVNAWMAALNVGTGGAYTCRVSIAGRADGYVGTTDAVLLHEMLKGDLRVTAGVDTDAPLLREPGF